jgi:hypothetical protein
MMCLLALFSKVILWACVFFKMVDSFFYIILLLSLFYVQIFSLQLGSQTFEIYSSLGLTGHVPHPYNHQVPVLYNLTALSSR